MTWGLKRLNQEFRGQNQESLGFPGGASGEKKKNLSAGDIRDAGLIPGLGRSPGP